MKHASACPLPVPGRLLTARLSEYPGQRPDLTAVKMRGSAPLPRSYGQSSDWRIPSDVMPWVDAALVQFTTKGKGGGWEEKVVDSPNVRHSEPLPACFLGSSPPAV